MAKKSAIEKNNIRIKKTTRYSEKRKLLKLKIMDQKNSQEERFEA